MARHIFLFDGGDELTTMGAAWFVSYSYYSHIDKEHKNWQKVSTASSRISVYKRTTSHHSYWLKKVLQMDEGNLAKNTLGLSGAEVKDLAKILITKI